MKSTHDGHCADNHQLFERSRFANEIGAAIHLTPNANSVLTRLGIDAMEFGAVEAELVRQCPQGFVLGLTISRCASIRLPETQSM